MNIAIQANPDRGKEIIALLESLGGKNYNDWKGTGKRDFYYIDENNKIRFDYAPKGYKLYTLEEFEKEFPFKVGDKVITSYGSVGIIRALIPDNDIIPYCIEIEKGYIYGHQSELKFYKEMERNITLTLDKAKEWYKKGGELKEIALQAFTEKELNPLPRSWEEFCENYPVKIDESWIGSQDTVYSATVTQDRKYKNWIPSKKSAEAHLAMMQLEQLRNCWWGNWKPEWNASHKYAIKNLPGELTIIGCSNVAAFLVFPTREMAEEFLECFRDLIEKARDLI